MKIRGGHLKRNIEIQAGMWDYAEASCRDGSMISVVAHEVDGDDFSVFIIPSEWVKTASLVGTAIEYDTEGIVWGEKNVRSIDDEYIVPIRDVMYIIFDNTHAKTKYKSIDIDINVVHPPLEVADEPLRESFEVDAGYVEAIDMNVNSGDTVRVFGRVIKGNDITVHILSKIYETPDTYHTDKAYFTKEKTDEIEIEYLCTKTESLLVIFDNEYSHRTTKTIDVSIQITKDVASTAPGKDVCPFCSVKIDTGLSFCPHCGGKL